MNRLDLICKNKYLLNIYKWYPLKVGLRFSCVVKPKLCTLTAVKLYAFMNKQRQKDQLVSESTPKLVVHLRQNYVTTLGF
ncbi:hypothetical protein BpHYR1_028655 [Brachionus plicatilis]|uniref:Uncharacterized protein n=1 Tax=Brachionus plicatilis TaxID=10195 RepID=A0A3M7RWI1_BRAPC|nr:hypothetical protein BpHYR1_028655 [Brachionus plicatilis]